MMSFHLVYPYLFYFFASQQLWKWILLTFNSLILSYIDSCSTSDIDLSEVDSTEDTCLMSNWSTHMVRGTWLANNHGIFYYGLPTPLLEHLRQARGLMLQSNVIVIAFFH